MYTKQKHNDSVKLNKALNFFCDKEEHWPNKKRFWPF